ncbi:MAG: DUF2332 family protein [Alphaproteobacteria bacterium]|nr:DUF2332 family protein [Alphaproteobacteria bacterium]
MTPERQSELVKAFTFQAEACEGLAAPFKGAVIAHLARGIEAGGPWAELVADFEGEPLAAALALRLFGALHRLAAEGSVPALAEVFRQRTLERAVHGPAIDAALPSGRAVFEAYLGRAVQTNEVMRSAALAPAYLAAAAGRGLPLRCLEIGASAGLNLNWPFYAYRFGDARWGPADSPLTLAPDWQGPPPPLEPVEVVARAGCDVNPIRLDDPDQRARARSYIWPDQDGGERLARFEAAAALAARHPPPLEERDAGAFLARELAEPAPGRLTIVAHSIVWQYLSRETRAAAEAALARAGAAASPKAPLAHVRLEPHPETFRFELRLTEWPGGTERLLGEAHPHGRWVKWTG